MEPIVLPTTYDELVDALKSYLDREDAYDNIPAFIGLAEIAIQQGTQLRMRWTESSTSGLSMVADQDYIEMPANMIEPRWLRADYNGRAGNLQVVSSEIFNRYAEFDGSAQPKVMMARGLQLALAPTPGDTYGYTIGGYYGITRLSESQQTNYLLTNYPSALLFGAILEALAWEPDEARFAFWKVRFDEAVNQINRIERRARYGGGPLRTRPDVVV